MKTLKKLFWIVVVVVMIAIPAYAIAHFLNKRSDAIVQGEIIKDVWVPQNCEVITSWQEWEKRFPQRSEFFLQVSFEDYKRALGSEGKHFLFTTGDGTGYYRTFQGKALISTNGDISSPSFVAQKEFKYLGNGKFYWKVEGDISGIFGAICGGIFVGVVLDVAVAIIGIMVLIICDGIRDWITERRYRKEPKKFLQN